MQGVSKRAIQEQMALVNKINAAFPIGHKVRVTQDDSSTAIWTMKAPASMQSGMTAVIWCKEIPSCYLANRLQFVRTCRECGCCDLDCSQCVEASGRPCSWVAPNLCSRCKAEMEAAVEA